MTTFRESICGRTQSIQSVLCVGLDTTPQNTPVVLRSEANPQLAWNRAIIEATQDMACCFKPNLAFYLNQGPGGIHTLGETIECAHQYDVPVILDAKFCDIGHTAEYYAYAAFETLNADAVTLNPYLGEESIVPFRNYKDRSCFILCLTSNVSRIDLQTLGIPNNDMQEIPLYIKVAKKIREWDIHNNLGSVVGATAPEELSRVREILGEAIPVLCPGVGAQGGDLEEVLWAGYTGPGSLLINVSRAIINASPDSDFAEASRREACMYANQIRTFLEQYQENAEEGL